MPRLFSTRLNLAALAGLPAVAPAAALAHAGDHSDTGFLGNLGHFLSAPDHLAMLGAGAVLVAVIVWLRKGRAE